MLYRYNSGKEINSLSGVSKNYPKRVKILSALSSLVVTFGLPYNVDSI